ncbi:NYN domain-containing protein [Candidatus Woesearchaeota archaeon]|nr:NYN domain-containing protein [Candidatus Woesearchaeota archaeon]
MAAQHKSQRVGIFVDVQNMYYSAKHLYNRKVNFIEILRRALNNRQLIRAIAYVVKTEEGVESSFFEALENIGYEVKVKNLQVFYGGHKKGDWDVGIAMDIMRLASKLDVIVLVSGDGDFKDLLEHASALGCRTEVLAFGKSASGKLKDEADLFLDLDKDKKKILMPMHKKYTSKS